jgi:hypothetical protein
MNFKGINWLKILKNVSIAICSILVLCLFMGLIGLSVKVISGPVQSGGTVLQGPFLFGVFVLSLLVLGWLFTLSGVLLGGYLVYHTKRDPYDPFLRTGFEKGQSFNLDDPAGDLEDPAVNTMAFGVPGTDGNKSGPTFAANNDFLEQISSSLAEQASAMAIKKKADA